jgi:hypothetical protein
MTMTATRRAMPAPLPRSVKFAARIPAALLMHSGKQMRTANHGTQ